MWQDAKATDTVDVNILRNASHNILYTVANSNSINRKVIGYGLETWLIVLILVNVFVFVLLAVLGICGTLLRK